MSVAEVDEQRCGLCGRAHPAEEFVFTDGLFRWGRSCMLKMGRFSALLRSAPDDRSFDEWR